MGSMIGGIVGTVGNIIGTAATNASSRRNTEKMIAAQERANAINQDFAREMTDKDYSFQREINDIMRSDAHNAIAIKKRDLQNAGYSVADPTFQGSSLANLTSARSHDASVAPTYTPEMARMQFDADTNMSRSLLDGATALSQIALAKAQARSANAGATGQEIDNDWKEAMNAVQYDEILRKIDLLKSQNKLTSNEADNAAEQMNVIKGTIENLNEDAFTKHTNNATLAERNRRELRNLDGIFDEMQARIANTKADTSVKRKQSDVLDFEKRIKSVEADFAELGINFNGNSLIDSLLRIIASPNGHQLASMAINYIRDAFKSLMDNDSIMSHPVEQSLTHGHQSGGVPTFGD